MVEMAWKSTYARKASKYLRPNPHYPSLARQLVESQKVGLVEWSGVEEAFRLETASK